MFSPYEELEYLSEYLPAEGEVVLVTRQSGELVCKPWAQNDLRDGIQESQLYGFLVQANERLVAARSTPLWFMSIAVVWLTIMLHGVLGFGWGQWYILPGLTFLLVFGCRHWIHRRQQAYFQNAILPKLEAELQNRRIPFYSLVAGIRQHEEFQMLLDEIVHWSPQAAESQKNADD